MKIKEFTNEAIFNGSPVRNLSRKVVSKYPGLSDQAIKASAAKLGQNAWQGAKKIGQGVKSALTPTANLGFGYEKPNYPGATGTAKGVLGRLASDLVGAENYAATAEKLGATGRPKDAPIKDLAKDIAADVRSNPGLAAQMVGGDNKAPAPSKFQQQFELVDTDPPTIQYKTSTFQRDQYGKWIDFRTGNEAPERFSQVMDRVSPPPASNAPVSQMPVMSPPAPRAAKPAGWTPQADSPAVWKSNRPQQPATPAAAPAAQAKARIARNTDGSVTITDKLNRQWTKPATGDYWTSQGELFRPGSKEYQQLDSFNQNLKESLGRKRR